MGYILHEVKIKKPTKEISMAGHSQTSYPSNQPEFLLLTCFSGSPI
jgi:hypothetical protein